MMSVAEQLAEAAEVRVGDRVLDVGTGAGEGAIAAARLSGTPVVGLDYVPALLERARERAAAEGHEAEFVVGDPEQMPFEDGSFDVVLSLFGAMFAADHQRTADELVRVCRPGGRIAMANWTPAGFAGEGFAAIAQAAAPSPEAASPPLWGTEGHLRVLFGDRIAELRVERRHHSFRYRSAANWLESLQAHFEPLKTAYERGGGEGTTALTAGMHRLLEGFNTDTETLVADSEYLQVVALRS